MTVYYCKYDLNLMVKQGELSVYIRRILLVHSFFFARLENQILEVGK